MERETQRKYPIFETLSTEELEKLLAQDFAADDGETSSLTAWVTVTRLSPTIAAFSRR